jgi:hypothetical protein
MFGREITQFIIIFLRGNRKARKSNLWFSKLEEKTQYNAIY